MNLPTKRTLYVILIWLIGIAICFLIDYTRVLYGGQITATWNPVFDKDNFEQIGPKQYSNPQDQ